MQEQRVRTGVLRQTSVNTPLAHARFLHGTGKGCVTIAQKNGPHRPWEPHSYPLEKLIEVVPAYGGGTDIYLSQNRFYGPRKLSRLAELSAMFSDVDYYRIPGLEEMHPLGVLELALEALERADIPRPSLAIATGRGLALVWRHEPVPANARSRWDVCQDRIFKTLKHLGADSAAKNATTVLRLVGTYNSRSGTLVETIWMDPEEDVWGFDDLANEILPLSREEARERRAKRRAERARRKAERPSKGQPKAGKGFTPSSLHRGRLRDLHHLLRLRGQDKLPAGGRNDWMFIAAISLSGLIAEPQTLEKKLIEMGKEKAGWSEAETKSRMHSVLDRGQSAAAGNKVEWAGQVRDTRYWLRNETIIEKLGITHEEELEMKVIISKETKRQRNREQKERSRRASGARPRSDVIAEARERRQHLRPAAKQLRAEGKSLREIGRLLGISHTQVKRLLEAP